MTITLHERDLPEGLAFGSAVAVDSETLGLNPHRDRLCLVQLSAGDGNAHLVRVATDSSGHVIAPHLRALMANEGVEKIFHFGRFDMAVLLLRLGVMPGPVYCTKIASKLARTYTDRHGLKDLCRELLGVELSKEQQSSDWGADRLSPEQQSYAAADVLYLHRLQSVLDAMLVRERRDHLAKASFGYLPTRVRLDLGGWPEDDIFAH
jgi:ribonuclease D